MVTARSFARPARLLLACGLSLALLVACSGDDDSASSTRASANVTAFDRRIDNGQLALVDDNDVDVDTTTVLNPPPTITNPPTTTTTTVALPPVTTLVPKCRQTCCSPSSSTPTTRTTVGRSCRSTVRCSRPTSGPSRRNARSRRRGRSIRMRLSCSRRPSRPRALLASRRQARGRLARGEVLNVVSRE